MESDSRHAYLILAHKNFSVLKILLMLLDDARNDLFIHIDKKAEAFDFDAFQALCHYSSVYFTSKRFDIRWGKSSLVDAEMLLFANAHAHAHYNYYHLISGVDLPIKTQDEIHTFFQGCSASFVDYSQKVGKNEYERLSLFFQLPIEGKRIRNAERLYRCAQRILGINRFKKWEKKGYSLEKGSNWVSLTNEAVEALLSEYDTINSMTRFAHCSDEEYKQIILKKAGVPIYRNQEGETSNLRFIDWDRGDRRHPYTFRISDLELLLKSEYLFARKFDQNTDFEIVDAIYNVLSKKQGQLQGNL